MRPRYRWKMLLAQPENSITGEMFAKSKQEATEIAKTVHAREKTLEITLAREKHSGDLTDTPQSIQEAHNAARMDWAKTFRVWDTTGMWEWRDNDWREICTEREAADRPRETQSRS